MNMLRKGVVALLLFTPLLVGAAEIRTGEQPSIASSETIQDDAYVFGGSVSSAGPILGDGIFGGGSVLVSGRVSQDLTVGGGSVTILEDVGDDLRAGGGNITVNAAVVDDVLIGGGQTTIAGPGIGGDLVWGGGALRLDAPVGGDALLAGGEVTINAPIAGNVQFYGDKLVLGSGAVIGGVLNYTSKQEAVMEDGARVVGETVFTEVEAPTRESAGAGAATLISVAVFVKFLMCLTAALVLGLLFHTETLGFVKDTIAHPLAHLGRGFAALILIPAAAIVLFVTLLGVPLGALTLVLYAALIIVAKIGTSILLGTLVYKWVSSAGYVVTWLSILIGVVLTTILGWIPLVGWVVNFLFFLATLGVLIDALWRMVRH